MIIIMARSQPTPSSSLIPSWQERYAIEYCVIKTSAIEKHFQGSHIHLDTLKTPLFCKDTLNTGKVKRDLGVQAQNLSPMNYFPEGKQEALLEEITNNFIFLAKSDSRE